MFPAPQVWDVETNELIRINFGVEYVYLVKLGSSDVLALKDDEKCCHASFSRPMQCQMCLADWPIVPSAFGPLTVRWTKGRAVSVPYRCHLKARHLRHHAPPCAEAAKVAYAAMQR